MQKTFQVNLPATHFEIEITLAITLRGWLRRRRILRQRPLGMQQASGNTQQNVTHDVS
jgi:hypothetical protein